MSDPPTLAGGKQHPATEMKDFVAPMVGATTWTTPTGAPRAPSCPGFCPTLMPVGWTNILCLSASAPVCLGVCSFLNLSLSSASVCLGVCSFLNLSLTSASVCLGVCSFLKSYLLPRLLSVWVCVVS